MKESLCNMKTSASIGMNDCVQGQRAPKEETTLERLTQERNDIEKHLNRLNEAIAFIRANPEADASFRKLKSLGAY